MSDEQEPRSSPGPFRVDQLKPGDRYELSDGHAYYCAPTNGDGARGTIAGGQVLDSDPDVDASGFDAGYTRGSKTLWAPDIAVGNVPDRPGWIKGAPLLGVEYASVGQDEPKLQRKIIQLFDAGTRYVWVVRLVGERRVEVYERGKAPVTFYPDQELTAPGVLRNPVPVEALYDRATAQEVTFRNLLQRKGYARVEDIREEGRELGREEGREFGREEGREQGRELGQRELLLKQLRHRFGELSPSDVHQVEAADSATLALWAERIFSATSLDELLAQS